MLAVSINAEAYDFEVGGIYYNILSTEDLTCAVTKGGNKYQGDIVIPSTVEYKNRKLSVVAISDKAFQFCSGLTSVTLPQGLISIGRYSFEGCTDLMTVTFSEGLTSIGSSAFEGCSNLTTVTLPEGLTSIGSSAFWYCSNLTTVTLPEGLTEIHDGAFSECRSLSYVSIPSSVLVIGQEVFCDCESLKYIDFDSPSNLNAIWEYAFSGCKSLTSVVLPPSLTKIGWNLFKGCSGLKKCAYPDAISNPFPYGQAIKYPANVSFVEDGWVYGANKYAIYYAPLDYEGEYIMPNVTKDIGDKAFMECSNMTAVKMSGKLKNIGKDAFKGCGLNVITIPPSVSSIGTSAFADNTDLKEIKLSYGLTTIADKAFSGCRNIENVYITASTPPIANDNVFSGYNAELWINNKEAYELYASAPSCWYWFGEHMKQLVICDQMNCKEHKIRGKEGTTLQLNIQLNPENVTLKDIFWESTNNSVATVDVSGQVTFVKALDEDCKIIAMSMYENMPNIEIPVTTLSKDYIEVESISIDCENISLVKGETAILKVSVLPENASNKSVVWSSSNESVAEIKNDGTVVAISEGEVVILATAEGGLTAECKVYVLEPSIIKETICELIEIGRYDLTGKEVLEDYRGIVIVCYSDGSISKIVQR